MKGILIEYFEPTPLMDPNEIADTIAELKQQLAQRGGAWAELFTREQGPLCSINQQMASEDSPIKSGDEVAFFPPVTGG